MTLCMVCGENPVAVSGKTKTGKTRYRHRCVECIREARQIRLNGNRDWVLKHKKDHCEKCGFIAEDPCQLDVDHIDGNRLNSEPSNFQTLCSNCHRLKTIRSGDHLVWGKYRKPGTSNLCFQFEPTNGNT